MHLNVTTTGRCSADCIYCPQAQFGAAMQVRPAYLSPAEFAALLPNLASTRFDGVSFGGFSEPFENPDIVDLLSLAAEQSFAGALSVYSNGAFLTPEVVRAARHLPLARVDVSCHPLEAETYRRTRRHLDPALVYDNLVFLLQNRSNIAELVVSVTGPFGGAAAMAELEALCVRFGARFERRALHSRAGLLGVGRREPVRQGPFRCAKFDFGKPVLVPGGDLSLCCQDFSLSYIIGNLHWQSFGDIMETSPLRRHVLDVAAGRVADPSLHCYQCVFCVPSK